MAIIKNHCYTISMPESTKAKHRTPSINSVLNKIRFVEDRQTCEYYSDRETLHILSSMNWLEGKDDIDVSIAFIAEQTANAGSLCFYCRYA